ncbi:hypothetical protein OZ668_09230 [Elizabethkingia sp. HX XZB]|uniref:hypothetical protein n=1 Tax=Elizabethkingia sp. HX XZB TaxID=3003193 RepID=UPI002A2449DC|nr:hypothetical protein [Elizabethkingia sp. HX XZB]MDX8568167.1 hypothetical protein [Elizabethkingia sp. HX XZB]
MKLKLTFYVLLTSILLTSCMTTPSYYVDGGGTVSIDKGKKYILVNNNVLSSNYELNVKVKHDFEEIFKEDLYHASYNRFLEFDNKMLADKVFLDEDMLAGIKNTSKGDYLIFIRFFGISKDKNGKVNLYSQKKNRIDWYREFHVLLQVYDLNARKDLLSKVCVSVLERVSDDGLATMRYSQILKTYNKVMKEFRKSIIY